MASIDALVTDANQRVALEVIRCLGKRTLEVCAVETSDVASPLSFVSNYVTRAETVDDYRGAKFANLVEESTVVFPVSTNTLYSIYEQSTGFPQSMLLPEEPAFRLANSKSEVRERARSLGVPVPETQLIRPDETPAEPGQPYPVVLKLENDRGLYLAPAQRYRIVRSDEEFQSAVRDLSRHDKPILVQEYVTGGGYGYSLLMGRDSDVLAGGGHHRLREYPPSGGPSAYCESVEYGQLRDHAVRLLRDLEWVGPAMVEFRRDPEEDRFYLLEVNPRYWGSLPLFRFGGMNLPYRHYREVRGQPAGDGMKDLPAGTKLKFTPLDFMAFFAGELGLGNPGQILSFLREQYDPSLHRGIWDRDDPMPFFRYVFSRLLKQGAS